MYRAFACLLVLGGCPSQTSWGHAIEQPAAPSARRIDIAITQQGFEPKRIEVASGQNVTLVFTRQVEHTCAKKVIVLLDEHAEVARDLPMQQPVAIGLRFDRAGELGYTCGMKMLGGTIVVR